MEFLLLRKLCVSLDIYGLEANISEVVNLDIGLAFVDY